MSNLIGQSLGRYHILEQLGEGGMAVVYKAFDTRLETDVAVKVIRIENILPSVLEKSLKRFEREAKSLAKLTHPNIVKVTDYGEHEGKPYLVMSYLPGGTLKERLKGGAIPWQEAVQLLLPIAHALEYAHEHNLIHRDVKPSNILLTEKGQPMLTDFGVAKLFDVDETAELTGTGMGIGTPEYMAPEQWTGHVTPQTDIYALGVVFYEMVTGCKPYQADTPAALLLKQANDPLPRPRSFVTGLPEAVEKVLFKALAKGLEDRYQGMGEMIKAMEGLLTGKPVKEARPARRVKEETLTAVEFEPDEKTQVDEKPIVREKSTRRGWVWGVGAITFALLLAVGIRLLNWGLDGYGPLKVLLPAKAFDNPQDSFVRSEDSMIMVLIPVGDFIMGSNGGFPSNQPAHAVTLDEYWIDRTEVTNEMFSRFVNATGYVTDAENAGVSDIFKDSAYQTVSGTDWQHPRGPTSNLVGLEDHPVVHVSWNDAVAYCTWVGARLPSEAEWEKAARGTDGRLYPWGDSSPNCEKANGAFDEDFWGNHSLCMDYTSPVSSHPSGGSPYGILDMTGNVWEWVNDYYDENYYSNSPYNNPQGPLSGDHHIKRGGAWDRLAQNSRPIVRASFLPVSSDDRTGFRCASSVKAQSVMSTPEPVPTPTQSIAPSPTPTSLPLSQQFMDEKGVAMYLVPAGEFTMGSDNGSDDEKPMSQVYLDAFYMDKYEVTNAFYKVCVDAGVCNPPSKLISSTRVSYYGNPQYDNFPVIYVNWNQAKSYCEWRGVSLPTESQWEKAARGIDGRIYPWGNEHVACQNNSEANTCGDDTMEVGSYEGGKSPYGLYDMGGNVFEWVENWYDAYPGNMLSDPNYGTKYRIVRGGSWYSHLPGPITYFRFWEYPDIGRYHIGFRCARSAEFTDIPSTPVSSKTSTGEIIHANAVVNSPEGGGANLRAQPAGAFLVTLDNGDPVELLGATQEVSGVTWVKVAAVKNGNRIEGWVMQSVLEFPTPTPTPTP